MIEKLVNSKIRLKVLQLFLSHIDDRYYLRELERMLEESLSPLRRQLLKLEAMGILTVEEEANVKYYKLNKNFEGLEELRELVLGKEIALAPAAPRNDIKIETATVSSKQLDTETLSQCKEDGFKERLDNIILEAASAPKADKRTVPQVASLAVSVVSLVIVLTVALLVYSNTKNIKQVAKMISNTEIASAPTAPRNDNYQQRVGEGLKPSPTANNGEMASKKWKVIPGNIPVLSSGETGEDKKSKEL